jgi:hypothetical protein
VDERMRKRPDTHQIERKDDLKFEAVIDELLAYEALIRKKTV